jgi:flagellin
MNSEFQEMAQEIDRIAASTEFNTVLMLNNSAVNTIHFAQGSTINVSGVDIRTTALGLSGLSIAGADGTNAAAALTLVSNAIEMKDSARATFGYKMNRIESISNVLDIQAENLMAAESRISDVDVALEMATLTRNQVLAQAGVAMLAQANSMPQMALSLLRM